jgi:altronate dehydratase small subunit
MAAYDFNSEMSSIVLNRKDNVATLLRDVIAGENITCTFEGKPQTLVVKSDIRFGHKVALYPIPKGERILKYGESIGAATEFIDSGEHVHVHNIEGIRGRGDTHIQKEVKNS